jgi:phage tail sheath protein FI
LSRKFTVVPFGGFDGWDEHRNQRTNTELYREGGVFDFQDSDYYAYLQGIKTFDNPEQITINLFATPGINFSDNITLVNEAIDMIENERGDSLYIIDAPDLPATEGYAKDIVELLDTTSIDSNYSATFAPWIEVDDSDNATRVFIPPTGEVVKAIAFTDKSKFPWYAPAGLTRGATSARRARKSLKNSERDSMYAGRVNPLTTFPNVGVAIFGQKTLQIRESLLDRINVRRLLLEVRKLVSNVAVRLVFEQNDQVVRDEFITKVTPILDNIRRERGLNDFRVIMDDTLNTPESVDRNELYGEILLKPIAAVEFIGIGFTITPSGASFDNI